MAHNSASLPTKKRILTTCVKLFLEKGYHKTTITEILTKAEVSCSSFQNIFHSKDGVLTELVQFMFDNQFKMARSTAGTQLPPTYTYAAETAIQLTLVELNENLRDIYLEAYDQKDSLEIIQHGTAKELYRCFGSYQPELTEEDFYVLDLGSSGMMRGYMAQPCDETLTLEKKLQSFLSSVLRVYKVPEAEIAQILGFISQLDIRILAQGIMEELFKALAMRYEFSLSGILPGTNE